MTGSEILRRRHALHQDPVEVFRRMVEIREVEDRIKDLFLEGAIPGTTHTCQGQEAVSLGVALAARVTDTLVCTYRGHGAALALGLTPDAVLGEVMGKSTGCVHGVGGSMHLSSMDVGLLPTSAIIGAGIPIAVGAALAAQVKGSDDIAISIFGDGAANIGAFHEGLNLAAVWKSPVVFVCENNLYGEYSSMASTTSVTDIADRGAAYGMPSHVVDGQSVRAVREAVDSAAERARSGGGPTLLEMKTYRYSGHSRSDAATYRPAGELDRWLLRDPITLYRDQLIESGVCTADREAQIRAEVAEEIAQSVSRARSAPFANHEQMFSEIYAQPLEASSWR